MEFTKDDVLRLAELARIQVTSQEVTHYQQNLASILKFVGRLSDIDTSSVKELDEVNGGAQYRSDEMRKEDEKQEHDALIRAFPAHVGNALSVPAVFEKPKG